jgi:hypothetical protein
MQSNGFPSSSQIVWRGGYICKGARFGRALLEEGGKRHTPNNNRNLHAVNFILLLLLLSILMNLYLNILFSEQTGLWRGGLQMLLRHSQSGGLYNFLCSCL